MAPMMEETVFLPLDGKRSAPANMAAKHSAAGLLATLDSMSLFPGCENQSAATSEKNPRLSQKMTTEVQSMQSMEHSRNTRRDTTSDENGKTNKEAGEDTDNFVGDIADAEENEPDEDEEDAATSAAKMSAAQAWNHAQKKRADYEAFDTWLLQNRNTISKTEQKGPNALSDEDKSAAVLVREFESAKIIESPRDYQIELFEKAKQKNIIAVLDTGAGKTLIAALLLRHTIDKELEDRANGKPRRVSFFLVDKVALVFQQHAVLDCNLSHPIAKFSGDKSDLRWSSKDFWDNTFKAHMVIVCTADILLKCLHHSYVGLDQINLLIFDEAHHTKKNHAYARIIKDFYIHTPDPTVRPKVFGMTASPVDARTDVAQAAYELEALLHSEITTVAPGALLHSVAKPKKERVLHYHTVLRPPPTQVTEGLYRLVGHHKLFSKHFHFAQENVAVLGPWIVDRFWQIIFRTEELAKQEAKAEVESMGPCSAGKEAAPLSTQRGGKDEEYVMDKSNYDAAAASPEWIDGPFQYSANVTAVRKASRFIQSYTFVPPAKSLLSNKVQRLHEALFDEFTKLNGTNTRCIVFVDQRYTAILLADLFQQEQMKVPNLRPGILIGGGSTDMVKNSFRTQLLTISKFKHGHINCLFATSVAEEGLDMPDCNLIVRFDLYHTMIQYVQSRGRARHHESTYIHMAELGNPDHSCQLAENKTSEDKMREFCNALPDDRKLQGNDLDMEYFLRDEASLPTFDVPGTNAKLTYWSSLVILTQYVSTLPEPSEGVLKAEYSIFHTMNGFICEILLPSSSPIRQATGRPHPRKQVAKCAAAFAMCLKLYEKKYIDKHLKPIFSSKLPAMRNARLAISSKKQAKYKMRNKPTAWSVLGLPCQLFATVLRLNSPEAMFRPSQPLVLLTRQPVPHFPRFPLFFGKDRASPAECLPLAKSIVPTTAELGMLTAFTLRAFDDVFSKEYEGTAEDLPYYIAPCTAEHHSSVNPDDLDARSVMDWGSLQQVVDLGSRIAYVGNEPDEFFSDKFVCDPFDGSRKFYLRRVRRDLTPLDPMPEGVPPPKHRAWSRPGTERNIINYSVSLWSKWRAGQVQRHNQPVVEADLIVPRRNLLDERVHLDDARLHQCFLVLGTLRISPLPLNCVAMLFNFPPIIHRLESVIIAMEAATVLGLPSLRPELALEAVTKDSDTSDDPHDVDEVPINFQAGMGRNYERLELLGDSFLKMASTIALFTLVPKKDEFEYHVQRMCIICNRNLFNNALDLNLEEYIRSREFDRTWYPPTVEASEKAAAAAAAVAGEEAVAMAEAKTTKASKASVKTAPSRYGLVLKKGRRQNPPSSHSLSDKGIADVCEAMIGAAYMTTYKEGSFDLAVRAVTAVVKSENHPMQTYADYFAAYTKPEWQTAPATAAQVHMAQTVAHDVGYTFRYPRLLRSAVMHPSYPRIYENLPSYQRLEFLGDALFDMAVVDHLFHRFPDKDPQWLTEHKMAMVSNQFLGALSVSLGLHKQLLSFSGELQKQVMEYAVKIEEARAQAEAETVQAGKPASAFARDYWVHVARPVKAVADVLEAYIGAMFVDSEYDYHGTVVPFFRRHVLPYFSDMSLYDTFANKHPVTFAVNLLSTRFGCRDWRVVVQETPDTAGEACVTFATQVAAGFLVHGRVVGHGVAESGRYAKIAAAKQALVKLDNLGLDAFQALTGCSCQDDAPEVRTAPSVPESVSVSTNEASTAV